MIYKKLHSLFKQESLKDVKEKDEDVRNNRTFVNAEETDHQIKSPNEHRAEYTVISIKAYLSNILIAILKFKNEHMIFKNVRIKNIPVF